MPTSEMTNRAERSHHDGEGARALVLVVTGTSGAGKGTLEKILLERMPEVELAVSATTREQRAGDRLLYLHRPFLLFVLSAWRWRRRR